MQINDRFTFERDQYGWQVHEWSTGESRKKGHEGEKIKTCKTSYHPTLFSACKSVIDRMAGDCESLEEIVELLNKSEEIAKQILGEIK